MVVASIPSDVQRLSDALVRELDAILGERFVALFQYGAVCFPPSPIADFDAHVVVRDAFDDDDRARIRQMCESLSGLPLGDELDVWYVTLDAMRSSDPPQTELKPGFRDEHWALHRAHVHAGRFVAVRGPDPRELVPQPRWNELDEALQLALETLAPKMSDAGRYAVLNVCRVLYSYENSDVVTSKFHAGLWALAALPVEHHEDIRAAIAAYADGTDRKCDARRLYEDVVRRVERLRRTA